MFHERLRYSATSLGQRGLCSLQFSSSTKVAQVNLAFWSGNVHNSLCLSEFPNNLQTAPNVLDFISSFLAVTSNPPTVFSMLGFDGRVSKTLTTELDQSIPICIVATFGYEDLYKMLAGPCVKILDSYDIHSVLQFRLMKLRTALVISLAQHLAGASRSKHLHCLTSIMSISNCD